MTLDVAISTYRPEGIGRLAGQKLPEVENVRYVVSWQDHRGAPVPEALMRPDITIHRFDGHGQSANRNNSVAHCTADIVLIGDDDLKYIPEGLRGVLAAYRDNPQIDFATFVCVHNSGRILPKESTPLKLPLPKGYSAGACELSFRRESVSRKGIKFHPLLGLNSPEMHSGEDEFFLLCAIKNGLRCVYFPSAICVHPHESTGTRLKMAEGTVRGNGCIIALYYPYSWPARILLKAWRLWRSGRFGFFRGLSALLHGVAKAPAVRKGSW